MLSRGVAPDLGLISIRLLYNPRASAGTARGFRSAHIGWVAVRAATDAAINAQLDP
ncbi:hypothetical protein [Cryobacterium sp. M23]|uniref:hypothetical protein n=1 Tax=Cryobacterium sp. M23 TaxID=2048292 RepID=UPI0013047E7F|nr:hypothetical protein [Cryobacterium sp. M23]